MKNLAANPSSYSSSTLDANGRKCHGTPPKGVRPWHPEHWCPLASSNKMTPVTGAGYRFELFIATRHPYPPSISFCAKNAAKSLGVPLRVPPIQLRTTVGRSLASSRPNLWEAT